MLNLLTEDEVAKQLTVSLASMRRWRLERQVGFEPTTLRLTAEIHPFYLNLPGFAYVCSFEPNLLPAKNLRVAWSCFGLSGDAGCWCTE